MDVTETGDPNDIMDRNGHGTHVSGIIAADGNLKGVGPDLGIRTYRVFFSEHSSYSTILLLLMALSQQPMMR